MAREQEPLLAAAGWTFAIWGLIFASQLAYALYQALPAQRTNSVLRRIGWHTALNALFGGMWTLAFINHQMVAALATMIAMLVNLVIIEDLLGHGAWHGTSFWFVRAPLGLNLGWIAVATILNISLFLHGSVGWHGAPLSPLFWSVVMVVVAALLALAMALFRRNIAFALAIGWALLGIADYRRVGAPALALTALALAVGLTLVVAMEAIGISLGRFHVREEEPAPHAVE